MLLRLFLFFVVLFNGIGHAVKTGFYYRAGHCEVKADISGCSAVKLFFDHGLNCAHKLTLGHILCLTLDLIVLKALGIVNGDRNFAITGSEVFERCFQKRYWLIY